MAKARLRADSHLRHCSLLFYMSGMRTSISIKRWCRLFRKISGTYFTLNDNIALFRTAEHILDAYEPLNANCQQQYHSACKRWHKLDDLWARHYISSCHWQYTLLIRLLAPIRLEKSSLVYKAKILYMANMQISPQRHASIDVKSTVNDISLRNYLGDEMTELQHSAFINYVCWNEATMPFIIMSYYRLIFHFKMTRRPILRLSYYHS